MTRRSEAGCRSTSQRKSNETADGAGAEIPKRRMISQFVSQNSIVIQFCMVSSA